MICHIFFVLLRAKLPPLGKCRPERSATLHLYQYASECACPNLVTIQTICGRKSSRSNDNDDDNDNDGDDNDNYNDNDNTSRLKSTMSVVALPGRLLRPRGRGVPISLPLVGECANCYDRNTNDSDDNIGDVRQKL